MTEDNGTQFRSNTPGKILREARERKGITIEEVAQKTKFSPKQITDLESGILPLDGNQGVYHRGLVRNYAKLVGVAPERLLMVNEAVHVEPAFAGTRNMNLPFNEHHFFNRQNKIWLYVGGAIGIAALSLAVWHLLPLGESAGQVGQAETVETELEVPMGLVQETPAPEVVPAPVPTTLSALGQEPVPSVAPVHTSVETSPNPVGSEGATPPLMTPPVTVPVATPTPATTAPVVAPAATQPFTVAAGESMLRFVFTDRSWVRVTDQTGKVLNAQLHEPGSELSLKGIKPFSVVIGNAGSVALYDSGKKVDLSGFLATQVARLKIE